MSKRFAAFMSLAILLLLCTYVQAEKRLYEKVVWEGEVVDVREGDTIIVDHDGMQELIRLYGIACPQAKQDYGPLARALTDKLTMGKRVVIEEKPVFGASSKFALVYVADSRLLMNELLVKSGYAWVDPLTCQMADCNKWYTLQRDAEINDLGLWYGYNYNEWPLEPWKYEN